MAKVDSEKCIGCGMCTSMCPEVFEMDSEAGKAKVVSQEKPDCVKEAAESCPVEAISE